MDYLVIRDAEFLCNIGETREERGKKQPILIDCRLGIDASRAAQSKNLKDAVDYVEVCKEMKGIAEGKEWVILEELAEELAQQVMAKHDAAEITICVKKPYALRGIAKYGAIEITRRRNG